MRYANAGVMAYFRYVLSKCIIADKRGYIPVVDMRDGENEYLESNEIGSVNAWEYFFEQPCGYRLEDIENARKVVYGSLYIEEPKDFYSKEVFAIAEKYIRFNKKIQQRIDALVKTWGNKYVLGVKLRGTDYITTRAYLHAVQPTIEEALEIVDETIDELDGKVDMIYLATEDTAIAENCKAHYGDKLYLLDTPRFKPEEVWHTSDTFKIDKKRIGEDYCVEIGALANCNSLVASGSQGTIASIVMNNNSYEILKRIRKGAYEYSRMQRFNMFLKKIIGK